jgi:hypothetical protein
MPMLRNGEQARHTLARIGMALGAAPLLVICVSLVLSLAMAQ